MWRILIPTANDTPQAPLTLQLIYRSSTHVVLELSKIGSDDQRAQRSSSTTHALLGNADADTDEAAEEQKGTRWDDDDALPDESERTFSPYFYIVEMAAFSETFWARYDRAWWFDKTRTKIIDGMYRVVHCGVEPFARIATIK
uniref:Uncharacterized protein n=1 Tax=Globisporangium ultimum (strain ATCC 200006 / CBS 805.95 / DAOM BR144) TaxID=431595 RepID=K3WKZ8_GLOUD